MSPKVGFSFLSPKLDIFYPERQFNRPFPKGKSEPKVNFPLEGRGAGRLPHWGTKQMICAARCP
jgi:hypothetical protein